MTQCCSVMELAAEKATLIEETAVSQFKQAVKAIKGFPFDEEALVTKLLSAKNEALQRL